jgi:hypothetical protein
LFFVDSPTRAPFSRERGGNLLAVEVSSSDLVRRVGYDLPAYQNASLDQLAHLMMADAKLGRGIA